MGLSNQERMGIIYKITFPNGKVYIGQTIRNLNQRIAAHISVAFNKHSNCFKTKLSRAIRKDYDKMKWSVLFTVPEFYLDKIEQWTINSFDSYKNGLNSTLGGKPIMQGKCHTKNTKKKMSKSRKGKKRPAFSQEWRNNISKSQKGIPKPKNKQRIIKNNRCICLRFIGVLVYWCIVSCVLRLIVAIYGRAQGPVPTLLPYLSALTLFFPD